jgi:diaminohydroxyphosphoribosylaminopyrimidine deaminase/5-amino-6-(5-phosphoribosylamino)uracil reductase
MAMSLDGRTAMSDGNAFWITGPRARADVQRYRARSCVVLSGWKSVQKDNSQMTVRPEEFELDEENVGDRQPLRVLVDSHLQLDKKARFFQAESPILVANLEREGAGDAEHIKYLKVDAEENHLDLDNLLDKLGEMEINELFVESGSELSGAFMRAGLVDELLVYVAPKLMGSDARSLFELPLQKMAESLPLHIKEIRQIGGDIRITAMPEME